MGTKPTTPVVAAPGILVDMATLATPPSPSYLETPRTQQVQDILGEANMGDMKSIFMELVAMLKTLPTGWYVAMSLTVDKAIHLNQSVGRFNCNKVAFKDAITLTEHGLHLVSLANPPPSNPPDALLASILVGIQAVEAKVDLLMLDMAN
ncbi:hypothetical protein CROQUDRAFT_101701 [Cronartium quercuum f. sp. fusiforme G11]|uniref:Uncharacterized protein n=1 Tax=Cronartium quercuum f. sp. fusiforme G11 TaxID=708437 RepID=A0A9P6T6E9_9BASI|nr:hypothetical protein CROQUDRAFT_101701 [Cronartium quercuum f. sp. fusiforme G11]